MKWLHVKDLLHISMETMTIRCAYSEEEMFLNLPGLHSLRLVYSHPVESSLKWAWRA